MDLRFRLSQFAVLVTASALLAQKPMPGPPASGVGRGPGPKTAVLPGSGTSLSGTPIRGSEESRYDPFGADLLTNMSAQRHEKLASYFAAQYQKKNIADTNRLVTLARELSADSGKSGNTPTLAELKKAEEIEKLARRVIQRLTVP